VPIYEFFCRDCNTLFNFYSRRINTTRVPDCPKCGRKLKKQLSAFATIGRASEPGNEDMLPGIDEAKMERALGEMAHEAEKMNEDDPRGMARLMRRFSEKTGLVLNENMEKALSRLEAGESPELIEQEMGDVFAGDDSLPFEFKKSGKGKDVRPPAHDETLYELE
jgi:putative FmdB family regulatory protein